MIDEQIRSRVEETFLHRMNSIYPKLKPTHIKYLELQAEFFSGAMIALNVADVRWSISIMRGDDILKDIRPKPKGNSSTN